MAKALKKMSTGKKVGIGTAVVVAVGAILCYFFCPCFKKKDDGIVIGTDNYDFGAATTGEGVSGSSNGLPEGGVPPITPNLPRPPAAYSHLQLQNTLLKQQGKGIEQLPVVIE